MRPHLAVLLLCGALFALVEADNDNFKAIEPTFEVADPTACSGTAEGNAALIKRFLSAGTGPSLTQTEAQAVACLLSPTLDAAIAGNNQAVATLHALHAMWQAVQKPSFGRSATCDSHDCSHDDDGKGGESRFNTWMANLRTVLTTNSDPASPYWAGLNAYSDLSYEEFSAAVLMNGLDAATLAASPASGAGHRKLLAPYKGPIAPAYPAAVDWQAAGKVMPPGFQGACAASWAFAAAGAVESRLLIATNSTVAQATIGQLSARQLLECATATAAYTTPTCAGGYVSDAFAYASTSGLTSETAYPYPNGDDLCSRRDVASRCIPGKLNSRVRRGGLVKITGAPSYTRVSPANNKTALLVAVSKQPVVVYLAADPAFQHYAGGVFTSTACAGQSVNHALLLVGYNTIGATPSWLAVNSLGTSWGQNGLVSLALAGGLATDAGLCGMYQYGYYPAEVAVSAMPNEAAADAETDKKPKKD